MLRSSPPGCTPDRAPRDDLSGEWFRQPVLWLGMAIFLASLLGCIVMVVLA
jgi:hypothetical protein